MSRRGLSPMMATFLLIGVALVSFAAIFFWVSTMSAEKVEKFGNPIEDVCANISFVPTLSSNTIAIENLGDVPIYAINLNILKDGKEITRFLRPKDGFIDAKETDSVTASVSDLSGMIEKMSAVPVVLGQGTQTQSPKVYPCNGQAKALI